MDDNHYVNGNQNKFSKLLTTIGLIVLAVAIVVYIFLTVKYVFIK